MRFGIVLAIAVVGEVAAISASASDAAALVRVMLAMAVATQGAAVLTYVIERRHR